MRYEQEVILHAVCFPIAGCLAVVLFFDNQLFELEACVLKDLHHVKRHRNHMPLLPCVTHQDSAELVLFQNAVALVGDGLHFLNKIFHLQVR